MNQLRAFPTRHRLQQLVADMAEEVGHSLVSEARVAKAQAELLFGIGNPAKLWHELLAYYQENESAYAILACCEALANLGEELPRIIHAEWLERQKSLAESLRHEFSDASEKVGVSLIMPTQHRDISESVTSVLQQRYEDWELIIVNNGGSDHSQRYVDQLQDERVKHLRIEESGRTAARNKALLLSQGKYIGYLDDDDLIDPSHLNILVAKIEADNSDVVFSRGRREWWVTSANARKKRLYIRHVPLRPYVPGIFARQNLFPIHALLHTRKIIKRTGLFEPSLEMSEDWELWSRFEKHGKIVEVKERTYSYRRNLPQPDTTFSDRLNILFTGRFVRERHLFAQMVQEKKVFQLLHAGKLDDAQKAAEPLIQFANDLVAHFVVFKATDRSGNWPLMLELAWDYGPLMLLRRLANEPRLSLVTKSALFVRFICLKVWSVYPRVLLSWPKPVSSFWNLLKLYVKSK